MSSIMPDTKVKALLLAAILIAAALPLAAACYFLDDALQTSLNLGFNAQIMRTLDIGSRSLKSLKSLDPAHEVEYRREFEEISDLRNIYSRPEWVKHNILQSLEIYFAVGSVSAVALALIVAALLGKSVSRIYRSTFEELIAERERAQYLEHMASWQELARILAHEIKNPLTPIEMLVGSLAKSHTLKPPGQFQQQLRETHSMIIEELDHLKRTVSRFSDFARLPTPQLVEVQPAQLLEQQVRALRISFADAQIDMSIATTQALPRVRIDPAQFRQALSNLINNGIEANPGRRVHFRIELRSTGRSLEVTIGNDGEPIPSSIAPRMFEPYVSTKNNGENMGLGLVIVRKIVIEHGGEVSYKEYEGHPLFTISLPGVA
jgi:signal transduction histidine kinase